MAARGGMQRACGEQCAEQRGGGHGDLQAGLFVANLHGVDLFSSFASMIRTGLREFLARTRPDIAPLYR
jgi:hypothetical protein